MNITRGKREDKTETEAMLLRIYDRLRKRQYREIKGQIPFTFHGDVDEGIGGDVHVRVESTTKWNPYLDGVRDALEAVAEEVGE